MANCPNHWMSLYGYNLGEISVPIVVQPYPINQMPLPTLMPPIYQNQLAILPPEQHMQANNDLHIQEIESENEIQSNSDNESAKISEHISNILMTPANL